MSAIDIVFGEVNQAPAAPYIEQKIRAMFAAMDHLAGAPGDSPLTHNKLNTLVKAIEARLRRNDRDSIPLAKSPNLGRLSGGERRVVEARISCLIDSVNAQFPLLDGEHLQKDGDFPSYLKKSWSGYERHAVVLRRRTNLATTYYFVRGAVFEKKKGRVEIAMPEPQGRVMAIRAAYEPAYGNAARELAKALAGFAEPPFNIIGAFLINAFWPTGSSASANWEEVYKNLQEIIKNGLAAHDVKQASDKVQGFVSFLSNEYVELKKSKRTKPEALLRAMHPYDTAFFMDIVNVFMHGDKPTSDIATASLANFMLGANLHIALNQERALVDPDYRDNPAESPYAKTAANLAKLYAEYARAAAPNVINLRVKQITGIKSRHKTNCQGGPAAHCTTTWYYWFEDPNPKPRYKSEEYSYVDGGKGSKDTAKPQAKEARKKYVAKITKELNLKAQVYDVADYWDKIAKNPIAMAYSAPKSAPGLDPNGWAGQTPVRGSRRWRDGYRVRYAASFYQGKTETKLGPWWSPEGADEDGYLAGSPKAMPTLVDVPIDPFYHANGRIIYRQFAGAKKEKLARLSDNQTAKYQDKKK